MSIKHRDISIYQEYKVPNTYIESEGEKLIKDLSQKQLNTTVCLKKELSKTNNFTQPEELINIETYTSGEVTLNKFKEYQNLVDNLETLKNCGLSDDEINFFNDYRKGENYLLSKHKNLHKTVFEEKLKHIFKLIDAKFKVTRSITSNCDSVSRHVKELALCTKPNSDETKLYKFALSCSTNENSNCSNSKTCMDYLPQLETELFEQLDHQSVPCLKKRRKKAKKYLNSNYDNLNNTALINHTQYSTENECNQWKKPKWDSKEIVLEQTKNKKEYTCEMPQSKHHHQPKNKLNCNDDNNEKIKLSNINCGGKSFIGWKYDSTNNYCMHKDLKRISLEEIKVLPRFQNYETGTPSKILFIKNLAKCTKEQDLVNLFSYFDNENKKITYRLLCGKMVGQAFISFNSIHQATTALETINGCILNNKPIIIQYGKNNT